MKLDFLFDFKSNELEIFALISMVLGCSMFVIGAAFDPIAMKFLINHQQGFGLGQVVWCAFWGLYSFWAYSISIKWGEK